MDALVAVIAAVVMLVVGLVAGYFYQVLLARSRTRELRQRVERELGEAEAQQRAILSTASDSARDSRRDAEREVRERRRELRQRVRERRSDRDWLREAPAGERRRPRAGPGAAIRRP